jgi:uncharacterized protein YndB with AHSA1/START domain
MPVNKDRDGNRSVAASVEVPGSPDEVWRAIATGAGISSWFVPTAVEEREGGTVVASFGPGMDSITTISQWDPPRKYVAETGAGPDRVATEWTVETRAGGTCEVRVVHRWFSRTDDWDAEYEGHAYGWTASFFRILRLYLTHFPGEQCSAFQHTAFSSDSAPDTWRKIRDSLHVDESTGRVTSTARTPTIAGVVDRLVITDPELLRVRETAPQVSAALEGMAGEEPELMVRLDQPAPGVAHVFVMPMGDSTMVSLRMHLYGDEGAAVAADTERAWRDWLAERFSMEMPEPEGIDQ